MANERLTDQPTLTTIADGDWLYVVDVSDTTDSPQGSGKKITKFNLNLDTATFGGSIVPTSPAPPSGKAYWLATQDGTYTNYGGVVVNANSIAVISVTSAGVFSISQTPLNLTNYLQKTDVIDSLTSTAVDSPASANSVRVVDEKKADKSSLQFKANLVVGKNLFNKDTIVDGLYIKPSNGTTSINPAFCYSQPMPVLPNTQYRSSPDGYTGYLSYDVNGNFISGLDYATGLTTGASTRFVVICFEKTELNTKQFELGSVATTYEPYTLSIPKSELKNATTKQWTADTYSSGEIVNYLGKDWIANANTLSTDIPNTSTKWDERLIAYAEKKKTQAIIFPDKLTNLNLDDYKTIGSFQPFGGYDNFSNRKCIKDYPLNYATEKFIFVRNIIGTQSRNLCFFNSAGEFIAPSLGAPAIDIVLHQNEIIPIPPTAVKFGCTLVSDNLDTLPTFTEVQILVGLFETDFVIENINNFSLKGGSTIDTTTFLTKDEAIVTYPLKSTTETQLSTHTSNINDINADVVTTKVDIVLVKNKLDSLVGSPPDAGAITGNNVFTGNNTFAQPIKAVAAVNDDEVIRKGEYKKTLNRYEDAADYGFLPTNTATANVTALNAALLGGNKTLVVSKPGVYFMDSTVYIDDYTNLIFGKGVVLQKVAYYMVAFVNRGALTRSLNTNIKIQGLKMVINNFVNAFAPNEPLYGLSGIICFFHINNLEIFDTEILDIPVSNWGIQVCTFTNLHINGFVLKGNKDGIHLGRGKTFLIENGVCDTYDDAVALNGHDYTNCNPEIGSIEDGIIRNITDLYKSPTTGYFSRLLIGAWVDWYSGIQLQKGDAIVHGGKTYRIEAAIGASYNSTTAPSIPDGQNSVVMPEGFTLIKCSNDAVYSANIINVKYENIKSYSDRNVLTVELDFGSDYNRSIHPTVSLIDYPTIEVNVQNLVSTTTATMMGIPPNITSTVMLEKCKTNGMLLAQSSSLKSKIIIDKCDFRNITGPVLNFTGADVIIKDSITNIPIDITIGTGTRIRTLDNLLSIANVAPIKGDYIVQNYIPKIYNGTAWIDQI